jgi:hypothetical protein
VSLVDMGEVLALSELVELPISAPLPQPGGGWRCEIMHVDRFGNLITNFRLPLPRQGLRVGVGGQWIQTIARTFADVEPGRLVAYAGSSGYLEVAVREGSAADVLAMGAGDPVEIEVAP